MVCGLLSKRAAALAAAAACVAGAAATVPHQACDAETGRCPSVVVDELLEEGDQASLLMKVATKVRDHAAARAVAGVNGTGQASCNELKFQGLCYMTCTDLGAMEPRRSASNCGGTEDYSFLKSCDSTISGSAPGLSGRPAGGCHGDDSKCTPAPTAPNMCTTDSQKKAPHVEVTGCKTKFYCADGVSTPSAEKVDKDIVCSCPLGKKPPFPWLPAPVSVLTTPALSPCNTGCSKAKAWKMVDGVAYCCKKNKEPTVQVKKLGSPDYKVQCSCPN